MDKYKKLFSNTIVFAIGTFSSKILAIILTPFMTRALKLDAYGTMDIIQQTVNVLVPLSTMAVNSAALRFAMEKAKDKRAVFSTGVFTTGIGFGIFLCFTPLLSQLSLKDVNIGDYIIIIAVFLLSSATRQLCQQFVRGMGWVRLYAVDGILATFTNLVCNLLFLGVFKWGVEGAILAIVTSDVISIVFLTVMGRLDRFIRPKRLKWNMTGAMLKYSIPLVPTAILWLIINVSDRYMVTGFLGADYNGLYAAASKIPNFVILFAGIFIDAWQLSAVDEYNSKGRGHFFTKIFKIYSGSLFAIGSGLILFCRVFTKVLVGPDYYESWVYVPILILSTVFSCLVNFLASIYMAEKKNAMSMMTALAGAILNVGLNLVLIPKIGINGAALATLISFLLVFILRAADTKRFVRIRFSVFKMVLNTGLLGLQSALMIFWDKISDQLVLLYAVQAVLTLIMILLNGKPLMEIAVLLFGKYLKKKKAPVGSDAASTQTDRVNGGKTRDIRADRRASTSQREDRTHRVNPRRERYQDSGAETFETPSDTSDHGTDYLGLGFSINNSAPAGSVDDLMPPEPAYEIKYEDDFAGEYGSPGIPADRPAHDPAPPPRRDERSSFSGKVTEYTDTDDETYFGEESFGFIRKPDQNGRTRRDPFDQ